MSKITGKVNYKEVLKGDTGYTYTPNVTTEGILYWSNNGNLPNPYPVNIRGEKGDTGEKGDLGDLKESDRIKVDKVISDYEKAIANITNGNENATNSEIVQARGEEKTLGNRIDKINNIVKQYTSASSLNMIPNSERDANLNYRILLNAIKNNMNIIIDETYYIKSSFNSFDDNNLVDNIFLSSDGKEISKIIFLGGAFFNCKGNIKINKLKMYSLNPTFLIEINKPKGININISDNNISGDMRILTSKIPLEHNFNEEFCYINEIIIKNNYFYDIFNSVGSNTIFMCSDTPIKETYIVDNMVKNFSYVFYDNSITNDSKNEELIYANTKNTYIENNNVVNELDYDPKIKNNGKSPTYFCFVILESLNCICDNNRFEGIKILDAPNTVVYDNYFSVSNLTYTNNTWKNIVNFTDDIEYLDIMKSKSGSNKFSIIRTYRKNTYIIEKEFADKLNKNRKMLIKRINTYEHFIDEVIIEDNLFDMYILNFNRYQKIKNYVFSRNTVKTYTTENIKDTQSYIGLVEIPNFEDKRVFVFSNNTILCEHNDEEEGHKVKSLLTNYSGGNSNIEVIFENNYIESYNLKFVFNDERNPSDVLTNPLKAKIKFNNNTLKVNNINSNKNLFMFTKGFDNLKNFNNNNFELNLNDNTFYLFYESYNIPSEIISELPICLNNVIKINNYSSNNMNLMLIPLRMLNKYNYDVEFKIKRLTDKTFESFNVKFKIKNDGNNNILECFGLDNTKNEVEYSSKSYVLDGSANRVYGNLYLKQENKQGNQTINMNVSNSTDNKCIMASLFTKNGISNPINDTFIIEMTIFKI